jgi:hypothetical protein
MARSRGLGDVYKRQSYNNPACTPVDMMDDLPT